MDITKGFQIEQPSLLIPWGDSRRSVAACPHTPMSHALIVVDLQNDFLAKGGYYDRKENRSIAAPKEVERNDLSEPSMPQPYELRRGDLGPIIERIVKLITCARELDWVIAFVLAEYGDDFDLKPGFLLKSPTSRRDFPCKPGTWGAQPIEPMLTLMHPGRHNSKDEIVVHKHTLDGFADTELMGFLAARAVHSVYVCGVETDACVLATAIGASRRFVSAILEDCTWTSTANGPGALKIFANAFGLVRSSSATIGENKEAL